MSEILRLFFNEMTANDKYSLPNSENVSQPMQMQLSKKQKAFSHFLGAFLKSTLNFQHVQ